jgi:hypothetical protein
MYYVQKINNGENKMKAWFKRKFSKDEIWEIKYRQERQLCEKYEFKYKALRSKLEALLRDSDHG